MTGGSPNQCTPMVNPGDVSCEAPADGARARGRADPDTSASMLLTLGGYPTFGDGSADRPGIDTNADPDSLPNESRLYLARESLAQVISAYPEIDFALARYHQDTGLNRSCQTAKWFECQGLVGTYDNPTGTTGTAPAPTSQSATQKIDTVNRSRPSARSASTTRAVGGRGRAP